MWLSVNYTSNLRSFSITSTIYLTPIAFLLTFNHNITMKTFINIINYITIRLFNMAIFSQFTKELLDKNNNFIKHTYSYCGYHKNYDPNDDWRFSENHYRRNVNYIKLHFSKYL